VYVRTQEFTAGTQAQRMHVTFLPFPNRQACISSRQCITLMRLEEQMSMCSYGTRRSKFEAQPPMPSRQQTFSVERLPSNMCLEGALRNGDWGSMDGAVEYGIFAHPTLLSRALVPLTPEDRGYVSYDMRAIRIQEIPCSLHDSAGRGHALRSLSPYQELRQDQRHIFKGINLCGP